MPQSDYQIDVSQQFTPRYRNYVLFILTCGYVLNFVDRQVMTILLEPIKAEFGASDTQMGLISGLAFALFYATLGVPVARLADRWSRRNVLAISMATWSAVTAACGMAGSFWQLALLRVGVGIGEAGGTPPSQSLLTDYFPKERRALAQGVLATAPNIGVLVGLFGGALIAEAFGWRTVFFVFGVPGVGLALLLFFTVKEPIKVKPQGLEADRSMMSALSGIIRLPSFFMIALGVGFAAIPGYGLGVWSPSFLVRVHGMSLVDAGLWLGIIGLSGGTLGTILSGVLADRLALRDNRWQLWIPAVGLMVALPLQALFLLWPASAVFTIAGKTAPVALVFMGLSSVFACFWIAPSYAAVQNLVPSHWRTQASALLLLVFNLLGLGLGPLLVGMLSDGLSSFGAASVRWALLSSLSMGYVAITCYWFGAAKYRSAVD
jgi:MFS family permease